MSVQAMTRVLECSQTSGVTRMVLLLIANHETEDRGAWPSIERLAREARAGIRTVQDAIFRARALGELEVEYRQGPHGTNVYRVLAGLSTTATLPGTEATRSRTRQVPHPADSRQESAPELKELGVRARATASSSSHPTSGFAEFYAVYPKHMKRRDALKAYGEALKRTDGNTLLEAVRRLAADPNLPDLQHIPYPATWLRADGWIDDPYPPNGNGRGPVLGSDEWARQAAASWEAEGG